MITSSYFTFAILLMAIITFSIRYSFFTRSFKINLNNKVRNILLFTAPCVLTAMFTPILFKSAFETHQLSSLLHNSYFLAGVGTIILSLLIRHTFVVILLSMGLFYGLRFML
ncbi:Predicted membrane protein [Phocoenobacter uteri]|uniref:Predicted membrane protein n=1 Tax=Phocoenobacter uteri TaxID=146806 RepID=A0A379C925_9PAST|nr:AzlD domain-containing protein [Phocoenobacter uteri]MDG6882477.1 hypothetical protein [Phocoenobacter uteri]SUB58638.1 Predicted membrane protein [Phocoenobacter uteri]